MEERVPKWVYVVIFALLAAIVVLAGRSIFWRTDERALAPLAEQKVRELDEKDKQVQALGDQIAQMRKELDESSKKMAELQARLEETNRALSSTQQKLKTAQRPAERPTVPPSPLPEKGVARSTEPAPAPTWRRPAEPGRYEVIRTTPVYERPSAASREVATISRGTRINVVGSQGDWLEVRSKRGNPPGFVRRDDAMFIEPTTETR
jgi:Tfp pilus assembly protein FimV